MTDPKHDARPDFLLISDKLPPYETVKRFLRDSGEQVVPKVSEGNITPISSHKKPNPHFSMDERV